MSGRGARGRRGRPARRRHDGWAPWSMFLWCVVMAVPASAAVVYQDFEPDNGTPKKYPGSAIAQPEYGWGFGGAVTTHSIDGEPAHSGRRSWKVIIPSGPPLQAGTGIPSSMHTYDFDVFPACHDRLTFWVWSDPSAPDDHTVMVKLFDRGIYHTTGVGLWTDGRARNRQWSQLQVLFSQLPTDFDLAHLNKVEFFHYWDGTYYYDDVDVRSARTPADDLACLESHQIVACAPCKSGGEGVQSGSAALSGAGLACSQPEGADRAILGLPVRDKRCVSILSRSVETMADEAHLQAARRLAITEAFREDAQ